MSKPKFELYRDAVGRYRWRLKNPKGEIIGMSEAYSSKDDVKKAVKFLKESAYEATFVDLTDSRDLLEKARELMMVQKPTRFELKPDYLTVLDNDLIAIKTADGRIVLYESAE